MIQTKRTAQSLLMLMAFTIFGKAFGFFREALIAARFGSGIETDTYFIAQSANLLFMAIISSSLGMTIIPILTRIDTFEGKKGKINHTSNLLSITLVVAMLILSLAWATAPLVMKVLAYGFKKEQFEFAVFMMKLGLPSILFVALSGVFDGYLQSENRFLVSSIGGVVQNFFFIIFLIFFASSFGIKGLMATSVIGLAAQSIILLIGVQSTGFRYHPILNLKDKYVQQIVALLPPTLLSIAIDDINSIIDKAMASTLLEGSISALNYANRLNELVISTFVTAIVTVLYPLLSKGAAENDIKEVKKITVQGINLIVLITIPATLGMLILTKPIVRFAYERGVFDSVATQMTAGALTFYVLSLVFSSIKWLIARAFYSLHDTKTPMINSAIMVLINVVMNMILIKPLAHMGLALSTSISSITTTIILTVSLRKKIGVLGLRISFICAIKSVISSLTMAVVVVLIYNNTKTLFGTSFFGELSSILLPIGIGAALYLSLLYLLKVDELTWAVRMFKDRMKRL